MLCNFHNQLMFFVCVLLLSRVWLFVTPWTVAHQAPLSMGIFQAGMLAWVVISYSKGFSQRRDRICISCIFWIGRHIFFTTAPPWRLTLCINHYYLYFTDEEIEA